MEALKRIARPVAPLFSARHRRWKRLLASLDFDPSDVPGDLGEPGAEDFIICGCPRTGTSLLSAQLFQPPRVVTVMEPWDGLRGPPAELFNGLRSEIDGGVLRRGRLDLDSLAAGGRVDWRTDGAASVPVETDADYRLGVKWPVFWRYLERLPHTKFLVCVRDPAQTIASFKRSGGRLAEGLGYDVAFNREMNTSLTAATKDLDLRRCLLYEYINSRILPQVDRPNVLFVRYERWFDDPQGLRMEIAEFLDTALAPWPASIRPPASSTEELSDREHELIRDHVPTAVALGYSPAY